MLRTLVVVALGIGGIAEAQTAWKAGAAKVKSFAPPLLGTNGGD